MSRRKTVKINIDFVLSLIKKVCRSNVVFCEKMGRSSGQWVSDWQRKDENGNPNPRNLPSPEEAARMCVLLQTTPEEILAEQADIDLVNALLDNERAKEKAPDPKIEGYTEQQKDAIKFVLSLTSEQLTQFINGGRAMYGEHKDD